MGVSAKKRRKPRYHHSVYVVLLARDVLYERKFVSGFAVEMRRSVSTMLENWR
jgi:hypothetical protein